MSNVFATLNENENTTAILRSILNKNHEVFHLLILLYEL